MHPNKGSDLTARQAEFFAFQKTPVQIRTGDFVRSSPRPGEGRVHSFCFLA